MIKNLTLTQHYDACIQMWNELAEMKAFSKFESKCALKYSPFEYCFMCEVYMDREIESCEGCPFTLNKLLGAVQYVACEKYGPYRRWKHSISSNVRRKHAIEVAQLILNHYPEETK